ncbi:alanine/glycine:cation symporter family protein [Stomatohabitans albus]|uniref:alanine/glycine:cation symporter family protein n=1 Tax=Stomatohabitans albus TaxID=3110766 RepID=UPI00300C0E3F
MIDVLFAQEAEKASSILDLASKLVGSSANSLFSYVVIGMLLSCGAFFTMMTRGMQFRFFPDMVKAIFNSRGGAEGGISGFQAFAIGLSSRVGTGNIVGVAIAILLGGPGAVFWMWLVALLGMATGLVEATLAQMYKVRNPKDQTFRGGPAWYIRDGVGSPKLGGVIAILVIFAFGVAFEMIQANTIAATFEETWNIAPWMTAVFLVIVCSPLVLGGIRPVARAAEMIAPAMALLYMLIALTIVVLNITQVPNMFALIVGSALGIGPAAGGVAGGVTAAMLNGVKRGLFSNEAGMGSVPNAAATATVAHPIQQGLIQSFGVFADTILVCSSTAFIILVGGLYTPEASEELVGATLTQQSVAANLGGWAIPVMAILIFVFAYSSILGNFTYAEVNADYLGGGKGSNNLWLRLLVIASVVAGAMIKIDLAWNLGDLAQAMMATVNLIGLLLLFRVFQGALRDYESQRHHVKENNIHDLAYRGVDNEHMEADLPTDVWTRTDGLTPIAVHEDDDDRSA